MSENIKKLTAQYNNYIYPKPCEDIENEWLIKNRYQTCDPNYHWHKLWPEFPYKREKMNILVAGCGSDQAAVLAKCNPIHSFIGIDLSENSLNHQKKLIKKHNIKNLKLICDDFRNQKFDKKFDYIISSGVIHHLDNPNTALKFFNDNLTNQGVLFLMVYGNQQSDLIRGLKEVFKKFEFTQDKESVESIKNIIGKLHKNHPSKLFLDQFNDFVYDAGVVDIFLHPKEKFYSLSSLIKELEENNFLIKNFVDGKVAAITKYIIDNPNLLKQFKEFNLEQQLDIAQMLNWNDRKIEVICTKIENKKYSKLYNKIILDDIFTYAFQNIRYKFETDRIEMINVKDGTNFKFNVDNDGVDWKKILSGQYKLKNLLNSLPDKKKKNLYNLIEFLIENYLLDFSFHKIEDYKKYYNSDKN